MIKNRVIRQIYRMTVTVILASALLILSSGCQDYIRDRQFEKLEDYVYGFVEDISTNPLTVISDNSVKKVKLPELTDDQQEILNTRSRSSRWRFLMIISPLTAR